MTKQRLDQIQEQARWRREQAQRILEGDADNYDGADGARYVLDLCWWIDELIAAVNPDPK